MTVSAKITEELPAVETPGPPEEVWPDVTYVTGDCPLNVAVFGVVHGAPDTVQIEAITAAMHAPTTLPSHGGAFVSGS